MNSKPLISVIMSAFNAEDYISSSLKSILNQSLTNIEIIIVDDGSTDKTLDIINEFANAYRRIMVISRENKGIVASLNEAASHATACIIARMDADDVSYPTRLSVQFLEFKSRPELIALGVQCESIDTNGRVMDFKTTYPVGSKAMRANAFKGGPLIAHPALMMRAEAFRAVGAYRAPFTGAEDLDLLYRLYRIGVIDNIQDCLLQYRIHERNVSKTFAYEQKLASSVLIELFISEVCAGESYSCQIDDPIDLNSIDVLLGMVGFRRRVLNRMVDVDFAYNPNIIMRSDARALILERLETLLGETHSRSHVMRREIIFAALKAMLRRPDTFSIQFLSKLILRF